MTRVQGIGVCPIQCTANPHRTVSVALTSFDFSLPPFYGSFVYYYLRPPPPTPSFLVRGSSRYYFMFHFPLYYFKQRGLLPHCFVYMLAFFSF